MPGMSGQCKSVALMDWNFVPLWLGMVFANAVIDVAIDQFCNKYSSKWSLLQGWAIVKFYHYHDSTGAYHDSEYYHDSTECH